jgi:excisionase family DNA binding protein
LKTPLELACIIKKKSIMHNLVLSPIDPEKLIESISERVTAKILKAVNFEWNSGEDPEKVLTIQQAAEFLNLTVPTMYSKSSKGELPVMKRGKRLYFSKLELTKYLQAGRKQSFADVEAEADAYLSNNKLGLKHGK